MISLRRTFLSLISRYHFQSTSSVSDFRAIDKCRKFYGRISPPGCWFYSTLNYEKNVSKVVGSEAEDKSFIEKYFNKLDTKIKNFGKFSKEEFAGILTVVEKEGCSQDQVVLLLKCCADSLMYLSPAEQTDLILSTWKLIKKNGQVSLACYNALLFSLAECNYKKKVINVQDILVEIEKSGLVPNEETYVQLLHYVCSIGDIDEAIYIVNVMRDAGIALNHAGFNFIILGHGRAGNLSEAENVLQLMNNSFVKPSSETYTMLLKVAAEIGDREKFLSYLDRYRAVISELQRLDIVKSLSIGQLDNLIPEVLRGGAWKSDVELTNSIKDTCGKLLHDGKTDSAFLVFDSLNHYTEIMSDPDNESTYGLFFIQEMIRSNVPLMKIIEICDKIHHHNSFALFRATEAALTSDKQLLALQLLETLAERGNYLRPHYFWPILTSVGKRDGQSGVLEILDIMSKLGVKPDCETLSEWVCIHCNLLHPVELVRKFQDKKLPLSIILTAVVQSLLFQGELKGAASVCNKFKTNLEWSGEKFVKLLSTECVKTGDINSVMEVLKLVKDKNAGHDILNYILNRRVPFDDRNLLEFVKVLRKSGFHVPNNLEDAVDNVCNGMKKVVSNNLNGRPHITHPRDMNVNELEHHLIELKSKKMNTRGVLRYLLQKHSQLGNIKRVLEIKKELDDSGCKFSAGMMASLLQTFVKAGLIQEAINCLKDIQNNYPSFKLDTYKIIDLASACVKSSHYESAVDILRKQQGVYADKSFSKNCWRLLNAVAEKYGPDKTEEIFNLLRDKKYCIIDNNILGPVIRSYLSREDFIGAVNIYEKCSLEYRCTPLQHELLCALLTKESDEELHLTAEGSNSSMPENMYTALLKRVVDIGEKVHGRDSTNNAVIVALASCNLVKRLGKFVKKSSKNVNPKLIDSCKRLADENKPEVLLRVINAVKNSPDLKIEDFYFILLKVYVRRNDCDGALALWTTLQEENINISNEFLRDLALLLSSNKRNVPFVVSSETTSINR